jgi:hypothetical protein
MVFPRKIRLHVKPFDRVVYELTILLCRIPPLLESLNMDDQNPWKLVELHLLHGLHLLVTVFAKPLAVRSKLAGLGVAGEACL